MPNFGVNFWSWKLPYQNAVVIAIKHWPVVTAINAGVDTGELGQCFGVDQCEYVSQSPLLIAAPRKCNICIVLCCSQS